MGEEEGEMIVWVFYEINRRNGGNGSKGEKKEKKKRKEDGKKRCPFFFT